MRKFLASLGPGLLMAGAAVGVSHLVQSTRAGASYGWGLLLFILLANFFKYPFFEYGHRYAAATGESLLRGYRRLGAGYLIVFLIVNSLAAVASIAAVSFVTGALLQNLLSIEFSLTLWCAALMLLCLALVHIGQYRVLDLVIKVMMAVLVVFTLGSFVFASFGASSLHLASLINEEAWSLAALPFLLALMGWMPAPVEISVWQSCWLVEKHKGQERAVTPREAKVDFNLGYVLTVLLAVLFCGLGALTMYGGDEEFSTAPAVFASQVIDLYTTHIGDWSWPIIATTAFLTMFSTTLTLIDGYPRSIAESLVALRESLGSNAKKLGLAIALLCCGLALVIIHSYITTLKALIDLVTLSAFLTAPLFSYLNYRLIFSEHLPRASRPGSLMKLHARAGLVFLSSFALLFLVSRFVTS